VGMMCSSPINHTDGVQEKKMGKLHPKWFQPPACAWQSMSCGQSARLIKCGALQASLSSKTLPCLLYPPSIALANQCSGPITSPAHRDHYPHSCQSRCRVAHSSRMRFQAMARSCFFATCLERRLFAAIPTHRARLANADSDGWRWYWQIPA
jgi:hypothetical protein